MTSPDEAPLSVVSDGSHSAGLEVEWNPSPQFRRMVAERDRLAAENASLREQAARLGQERDVYRASAVMHCGERDEARAEADRLRPLEAEARHAHGEATRLRVERDGLHADRKRLTTALADMTEERDEAREQLVTARQNAAYHESQVLTVTAERDEARAELARIRETAATYATIEADLEAAEAFAAQYGCERDEARAERDRLAAENASLTTCVNELAADVETLTADNASLRERLARMQDALAGRPSAIDWTGSGSLAQDSRGISLAIDRVYEEGVRAGVRADQDNPGIRPHHAASITPKPPAVLQEAEKIACTLRALTEERDKLAEGGLALIKVTSSQERSMHAALIDVVHGDSEDASTILTEALDGYDGPDWNGTETGAEWLERTREMNDDKGGGADDCP